MLESLRAVQNTRAGKSIVAVIMGLIMVSFVIWGIGPVFTGFNANQIASVGGASVTLQAFQQAYQTEMQRLQQQAKRQITNAQAHLYGIDTQVLSRLVSEAILDNQASALGLSISDDQIAKAIVEDPAFKGPGGQFDRAQFNAVLQDNELTEQAFVREQRNVYLRQEFVQGIVGAIKTPVAALDALHRFETETRSLDYIVLPASAAGAVPTPDDATLRKYFQDTAQGFRTPEYRSLVILPLTPEALAKPGDVPEAAVAALYDSVKDTRFATPEYRTLQQIVFPTEADATAASQRLKSGTSFADIAAERKLTDKDLDLGRVSKNSLFDKAVADAAFSLPEDGVSEPIKNAFGATIVHVVKIDPVSIRPLADVEPALRAEIASAHAASRIQSLHDKVEDARASGQSLAEAAKAAELEVRTIGPVDATGKDKTGKPVADLPDATALLQAAFASDVGVDNDTVRTPDGGQIFYEVAAIEPARAQTFDEVKSRVEASWHREQVAKALSAKADALVKDVDGGQSLDAAAAALGLPVQHVADVRRSGGTGLNANTVAQVFSQPVGRAASAPGDDDTRIVLRILGSTVPPLDPDSPQIKQFDTQYQSWLGDDMLASYLTQVQSKIGVRINPEAYRAAIGSNS